MLAPKAKCLELLSVWMGPSGSCAIDVPAAMPWSDRGVKRSLRPFPHPAASAQARAT